MRRFALLTTFVLAGIAGLFAACEKSNEAILQEQYREAQNACPRGCPEPRPGCTIKGNISGEGRKFYLLPNDRRYPLAMIEPARGEAWFCTTAEAEANGFSPVPPGI
jgi:hypothetical protein